MGKDCSTVHGFANVGNAVDIVKRALLVICINGDLAQAPDFQLHSRFLHSVLERLE